MRGAVLTQWKDLLLKHDDMEHGARFFSCGTGDGSACFGIEDQGRPQQFHPHS